MQTDIYQVNAFAEQVFQGKCQLRWFTPSHEVDLCGHATLAAAHALFTHLNYQKPEICFSTKSGDLLVTKRAEALEMDFPASMPKCLTATEHLL